MKFNITEKPRLFPEWVHNPEYLPSKQNLNDLHKDGLWDDFIHHSPNGNEFQILTQEFINGLADLLIKEIETIPKNPISVLEVGAGGGRLTHFLKQAVEKKIKDRQIIFSACDDYSLDNKMSGSLGTPFWIKKIFPVEEISVEDAVQKNPNIIISSWMPAEADWTILFRENEAVQTFVLIGREHDCGTEESWQADERFIRADIKIDGSVCWGDMYPEQTKSQVAMFSRRK